MPTPDHPPLGGVERIAAGLPAGLRAMGAAGLLRAVDAAGHHDVLAVGLVDHDVVVLARRDDAIVLIRSLPPDDRLERRAVAAISEPRADGPGAWGAAEHSLTIELRDGTGVCCRAVHAVGHLG